jgi:hypothetical protein
MPRSGHEVTHISDSSDSDGESESDSDPSSSKARNVNIATTSESKTTDQVNILSASSTNRPSSSSSEEATLREANPEQQQGQQPDHEECTHLGGNWTEQIKTSDTTPSQHEQDLGAETSHESEQGSIEQEESQVPHSTPGQQISEGDYEIVEIRVATHAYDAQVCLKA